MFTFGVLTCNPLLVWHAHVDGHACKSTTPKHDENLLGSDMQEAMEEQASGRTGLCYEAPAYPPNSVVIEPLEITEGAALATLVAV